MSDRLRLDELLVRRGLYPSRSRARDAILRGTVSIAGIPEHKPARMVAEDAAIETADAAQHYVSRAALKLKHAISHFGLDVADRHALDIGASTGGFTQVLLEAGAAHVTAIDVGHGQMMLRDDRITVIEGLNARDLAPMHLPHPVDLVVCDVSFISLRLALPAALELAEEGARLVALIKPQFEAGRAALGKGGIVTDDGERQRVCDDVSGFITAQGWAVLGLTPSPIEGGDGNREFLIAARKG